MSTSNARLARSFRFEPVVLWFCVQGERFMLTTTLYPNLLLHPNPFYWVVALVVSFMRAREHKVCVNVRLFTCTY